ncbi:MAG: hypothetical protein A2086_06250 [Spirochaetes bacterium GWD1_27_9]|nr:MAG: hypothetical protein A2Z98_16905 [Spirochaetes bacterium GWB1_27_13]OHD30867.1 MAG: hypothetical protein A2086_06250 [Spirochaetes bacterium GWD1_27_9]
MKTENNIIKPIDDNLLDAKLINLVNSYALSDKCKLKKKISDLLNNGKTIILLSSLLTKDNYFNYGYRNLSEAFKDLIKENLVFNFLPYYKLSIEYEEPLKSKNNIEFDIAITFNKEYIKEGSAEYYNLLSNKEKHLEENNKNVIPSYLYRLLVKEKCYFYPVELIRRNLSDVLFFDMPLLEIYKICLKKIPFDTEDKDLIKEFDKALEKDLFLKKENPSLNFTYVSEQESYFLNKKEIEELSRYGISARDVTLLFLKQNNKFNSKFNTLFDEIIDNFNNFLSKNSHIKDYLMKELPEDKRYYLNNITISNFEEIIQTLVDPNSLQKFSISEIQKKELVILSHYLSENDKYFLENISMEEGDDYSSSLRTEIIESFKAYFKKYPVLARSTNINMSIDINIIISYTKFMEELYKNVKRDHSVLLRVFNKEIRNKLCFFQYVKINEINEEVEFYDNPVGTELVVIPIEALKKITIVLLRLEFGELIFNRRILFLMLNILKLISKNPRLIDISLEFPESIHKIGFYNKEDFFDNLLLLEVKYNKIKALINEEDKITKKVIELEELKKHKLTKAINILLKIMATFFLRRKYYKFVDKITDDFNKKMYQKQKKDESFKKSSNLNTDEHQVQENMKIKKLLESLDTDEKKLFIIIYKCNKNKGSVEYKRQEKKLRVEIYTLYQDSAEKPQMFVFLLETLLKLTENGLIIIDNKHIYLSEKIKKYYGV